MNAAATFRTFGHFNNATTVNKLPKIPVIIIRSVAAAAKFSRGRLNLKTKNEHILKNLILRKKI